MLWCVSSYPAPSCPPPAGGRARRLFRPLQHGLRGRGPRRQVADVVPTTPSLRQWAETFPWAQLVEAVEQRCARRFPKRANSGRSPGPTRVLLALERLKHAGGPSDAAICARCRTALAVMYACGLATVPRENPQEHCVVPETLAQCRSGIDDALRAELLALQAAAAMDEGLVSPAPLLGETCPADQGSPRGTAATTRYTAPQNASHSSMPPGNSAPPARRRCSPTPTRGSRSGTPSGAAWAVNAAGRARSS